MQNKFDWSSAGFEDRILLSYGPCQFPTLGLIVQRLWCVYVCTCVCVCVCVYVCVCVRV